MSRSKNYYVILGVTAAASLEELKSAYRRLARQFHPDVAGTAEVEQFRDIQEAYETLASLDKRRAYDLTCGVDISYGGGAGSVAEPRFEPLSTPKRRRWGRRSRAVDSVAEIMLSPEEARQGGTLSFRSPGRGRLRRLRGDRTGFHGLVLGLRRNRGDQALPSSQLFNPSRCGARS